MRISQSSRITNKLEQLKLELKKYQARYKHMAKEYAATKSGSAYGVEYYDIQCKVYLDMIESIQREIVELKKKKY